MVRFAEPTKSASRRAAGLRGLRQPTAAAACWAAASSGASLHDEVRPSRAAGRQALDRSREWYIATLGLKVEFEIPARHAGRCRTARALRSSWRRGRLRRTASRSGSRSTMSTKTFAEWTARGVVFAHGPRGRISGVTGRKLKPIPTATSCACGTSVRNEGEVPGAVTEASLAVRAASRW